MKIPYKLNIIKKKEDTSKEKQEQCKTYKQPNDRKTYG
jgi:hypothetical protein